MRLGTVAFALGGAAVIVLVAWHGAAAIGAEVLLAAWAIPPILAIHAVNQFLSGIAWRWSVGGAHPTLARYFAIRVIREAVNSLLPTAQLGGNLVGIRMLAQRGVPGMDAAAGTTIDVTIEAVTQLAFALIGIAVLAHVSADTAWAPWVQGSVAVMAAGIAAFILVQQTAGLRLFEWIARRFRRFPLEATRRLFAALAERRRRPGRLAGACALQFLALVFGVGETWLALTAMGRETSLAEALVLESLGLAVRSAGFMVPAGLAVQEAGFLLLGGLLGLPPDQAIALSMVKRVRELAFGLPALAAWQWAELRRLPRR